MDFKPIHEQLERLNSNLETWIGLVSVLNSKAAPDVSATPPAAPAPAAETSPEPAAETESKGRGRPRKRYFYNSTKQWVQENSTSPGAEWVEVTKTKFEEIRDKISKGELKPANETPAAAPSDDPFADDAPTSPQKDLTLEEVRAVAFQVRDKFGMDRAKTIIAKFAPKLDQIKVEDYARFIAECNSALGDGDL